MGKQVIKRDGSLQVFDRDKIAKVVQAAGLAREDAEKLADQVADWVKDQKEKEISSLQIRDQVLTLMRQIDSYAANMFEWYQKTKDHNGND